MNDIVNIVNEMKTIDTNNKLKASIYENPNSPLNSNLVGTSNISDQDLRTIFVGFIPTNTSENDLFNTFSVYGPIDQVKIHQSKKSANIMFKDQSASSKAIKLFNGKVFKGQRITVSQTTKVKEYMEKNNINSDNATQIETEKKLLLQDIEEKQDMIEDEDMVTEVKRIVDIEMNKYTD